ncbi:MAG: TraC family protein [Candidatus Bathyarchaeia archaeon]
MKLLKLLGLAEEEAEQDVLSRSELLNGVRRNQLSRYLAPVAYDEESGVFYNQDDTVGFMYECSPVLVFGAQSLQTLKGLFHANYPEGTILQFILYADPDVSTYMNHYEGYKQHAPDYVRKAYRSLREFYEKQRTGNPPIRNYRLFFTVKIPVKKVTENLLKELISSTGQTLQSVHLAPVLCSPDTYMALLRKIINGRVPEAAGQWCKGRPINAQVISAETDIKVDSRYIKATGRFVSHNGSGLEDKEITRYFRCITVKSMPQEIDFFWANRVTGSYDGVSGDVSQINTPFWFTLNIFVEDLKTKIHGKANLVFSQQAMGSFIASLKRKQEEFFWAVDRVDKGEKFFRIIPIVWVYSEDEEQTRTAVYRVVKLWETTGAVMQEDSTILLPLFIYSLPFGCYADRKTVNMLDRDFIVPAESLPAMVPAQVDYMGTGEPLLVFAGRKGQLVGLNIFSQASSSYNFYIAAPTGKGKSFTCNYIVTNYLGAGAKIRMVDIGGSYRKLAKMFGGKFLEFSPESDICINPFSNIREAQYDIPVISNIILQMAISSTGQLPQGTNHESVVNLLNSAVRWTVDKFRQDASIDHVQMYLAEFPEHYNGKDILCEGKEACVEDFTLLATHLAFNLDKFVSTGVYGKYFNGPTSFDISQDDFVVLELEHLKALPDLFRVVVLQVLNMVTMDLYLSSRETPRMVIMDEAWQFLQDTETFQKVIEEGYRRARRYKGSFGIITQSILDLEQFGRVGRVINSNSAFKFFLESGDFVMARDKKLIDYDDFTMNILNSIKYNAPKYSEIFIHSDDFGVGVARLMVDPYSYYIYTSNPVEIVEIEKLVSQGMSYEEAIETMVKKYRSQ